MTIPSSSSPSSTSSYYLSKCILRGTAILQVLYGHFRSPSSMDMVFGKETSIELLVIHDDGHLQSVCDQPVFGIIKDLAVLHCNEKFRPDDPQMCGKDLLVAISDSGKLSVLAFCNEMNRFFPLTHVQLSNLGKTRDFCMLAVDSSGCFIAASEYEDQLALFSVSMIGNDIIDKKIIHPFDSGETERASINMKNTSICGTIWSMCFISLDSGQTSKEKNPLLAIILHRRGEILNELLLLEWNVKSQTIIAVSQYVEDGPLAHNIVEVPNSKGLAFLFRAGDVLLMNFRDPCNPCCVYRTSLNSFPVAVEDKTYEEDLCIKGTRNRKDTTLNKKAGNYDPVCKDNDNGDTNLGRKYICSWSWEPSNNEVPRMIFCVDTGEFFMIEVCFDSDAPKVEQSNCIYKGLPCKELLWVKGGYLVAIVEMGDGVVLKLNDGKLCFTNSILNMAPILDVAHEEEHGQMFACCGVAPEGSLRIIQSGIGVEKPCRVGYIYEEVVGTWAVRMKVTDSYHSFIVLSFVSETRVFSVGLSFKDVTASVGFQPNVCTLACGLVMDGLLVQIYQNSVKLCLPTNSAHHEGTPLSSPNCTCWHPRNMNISLGEVGHNFIVVSTSNPCSLFILGVTYISAYAYEVFEMKHLKFQNEISCISIARQNIGEKQSNSSILENNSFVIGTHRPSVEVWSFAPDGEVIIIAHATISLINAICIPQDVCLVFVGKYYVLAGLKNGMLLRFEWPSESFHSTTKAFDKLNDLPSVLQLIAIRHIGINPVFLVPLDDTLDADIIALSDKPWLLHTARQGLSYTSINVKSSSHLTPVCTIECPQGILLVAENSLHLAEMFPNKRLNMQKFHLEGTPRKVLYHNESGMLLVLRTELNHGTYLSDICCVDPLSGSVLASFELEHGEVKSMELVKFESKLVIVIGTSLSSGPYVKPSGEAEGVKGCLLVLCLDNVRNSTDGSMAFCSKSASLSQKTSPFHELVVHYLEPLSSCSLSSIPDNNSLDGIKLGNKNETWQFRVVCATIWDGIPLAICPYLDHYFLASAGNTFYVCGLEYDTTFIGRVKVIKYAIERTRFIIKSLTAHCSRIGVGDGRDGIIFFSYDEDAKKLSFFSGDPSQRLVADCTLMDDNTAFVSDCKGNIAVLCSDHLEGSTCTEFNLRLSCVYFMGEVVMSIQKCSFSYRFPAEDALLGDMVPNTNVDSPQNAVIASTLSGNIMIFFPLSREEYKLLEAAQAKLVVHNLTAPILGNDHNDFRSCENPAGVPKILDGDMLTQLLELTCMDQNTILQSQMVKKVVQILERVHYALN